MRALICGGRDFTLFHRAWAFLDAHHARRPITLVVTGLDTHRPGGADLMGDQWAMKRGIDRIAFPPNWEGRGKPGGPYRNGRMLEVVQPEIVFAFPRANGRWGEGTTDMTKQADAAGVSVIYAVEGKAP
ncbi:DUF2493 domain-containing protein [Methylobacterium sp. CCH5-D2]|uniref:DUF2493 domain-containing protein n=1 Tax=Methylobacterium sp. CCH5-D2 TaxID=1768765 RepID=UPI000830E5A8|nr:DUF2493 domain-containing protein [Methylobacterium sp. CCH5-D2]